VTGHLTLTFGNPFGLLRFLEGKGETVNGKPCSLRSGGSAAQTPFSSLPILHKTRDVAYVVATGFPTPRSKTIRSNFLGATDSLASIENAIYNGVQISEAAARGGRPISRRVQNTRRVS